MKFASQCITGSPPLGPKNQLGCHHQILKTFSGTNSNWNSEASELIPPDRIDDSKPLCVADGYVEPQFAWTSAVWTAWWLTIHFRAIYCFALPRSKSHVLRPENGCHRTSLVKFASIPCRRLRCSQRTLIEYCWIYPY